MDLNDLKINPKFEAAIRPLTAEEFDLLEKNILMDGRVIDPLVIWKDTILDGHNRYRIVKKHPEISFTTTEMDFPDEYGALAWIYKNQLGRRNLTSRQRDYLIGKQYEAEKSTVGSTEFKERNEKGQFLQSGQNVQSGDVTRIGERIAKRTERMRGMCAGQRILQKVLMLRKR